MGSSRQRGFAVTPERLAFIEQKMREMGIDSREALAEATTLSPDVIYKKLFSGKNVDRSTVEAIAKTLKIQPTELVEPERWYRRSKTPKSQASPNIDWQQVCRTMLDRQKKLSTNEVIASEAMQFDLLDDEIFISLALVERKEPERLSQNVHPARPIEQYEEKPPIEYEQFREQILRQGKSDRIAIIGEPGAGKTTLLQHIAFWILDKELGLPIWISLGDLIKNGDLQRLKDYLTQVWLDDAVSNVTEDVKSDFLKQLNEQRVWLLLDGADEIVASSGIALREINNQLRGWLSQPCIILTCRINIWEVDINALRDFQTYRTKQFHYPSQVEKFIGSGFRKSNQQSGERLKTELANTERTRLQQLVRNPLRLMMLCTTWQEQESLPATKAELYKRFVSEFYKWNRSKWKKKDLNYAFFPNTAAKEEKLNKALGRLAFRALDEESSPFRWRHNLVSDELGDPDEDGSNFWLALNLGWLQVARDSDKPSDKIYTFFHPTFQEYFAALVSNNWHDFLNHIPHNPNEGTYRIFKPQWKEVVLLWFGQREDLNPQKEDFINSLINFQDECSNFYSYQAYFLAAASTAEFNCSRVNEIIEQVVKWSFHTSEAETHGWHDFPLKEQAKKLLSETNTLKTINSLIKLIKSDSLEGIFKSNDCSLKQTLITYQEISISLLDGKFNNSQEHLKSELLARCEFILDVLDLIVKHDVICCKIIEIVSQLDSQNTIIFETAEKILKNDLYKLPVEDLQQVRFLFAKTLENLYPGNPITTQTLLELLVSTNNFYSRNKDLLLEVKRLLEKVGKNNNNVINCLIQLLHSERNIETYREAAEILGEVASDSLETIESLIELIQLCQDAEKKLILNQCLGSLNPNHPEYIRSVVDTLSSLDPRRCYAIIDQITRKNQSVNSEISSVLVKFITDVQEHLSFLYSNLEERENISYAEDKRNEILEEACAFSVDFITKNLTNEIIDIFVLENLLNTIQYDWYLIIIAKSLWRIYPAHEKAQEIFDRFLSKGSTARLEAAWNLISVSPNNPKAVSTLIELLRDEHDSNLIELFNCIDFSKQKNPDIILNLRELLEAQDEAVRSIAAQSLVRIDPNEPKAIHALVSLLNSPKEYSAALHDLEWSLNEIDNIDSKTIFKLIQNLTSILRLNGNKYYIEMAGNLIVQNCPNTLILDVVKKLKICLTKSAFDSEPIRYWSCYRVIWHCAQNMNYPDFYRAWDSSSSTDTKPHTIKEVTLKRSPSKPNHS